MPGLIHYGRSWQNNYPFIERHRMVTINISCFFTLNLFCIVSFINCGRYQNLVACYSCCFYGKYLLFYAEPFRTFNEWPAFRLILWLCNASLEVHCFRGCVLNSLNSVLKQFVLILSIRSYFDKIKRFFRYMSFALYT